MESAGVRLKKIRLEKGLSLEEVYKKTKIHLNILKAIEEDNLVGINPIYIKGFFKIYCRILDVDPKDYIDGYQESSPRIVKNISEAPQKPSSFMKNIPLRLDSFRKVNIKIKNIVIVISIISLIAGLFSLGKSISRKRVSRRVQGVRLPVDTVNKVNISKAGPSKIEWTPKDKKIAANVQAPQIVEPQKKAVSSGVRLILRAKENCWLHLAVDGKVAFHAILKKGKFENWQAKERIEFSLGNAGVVDLELNGKPIPPLGRRGQAIKNILITKDAGLVVGR